MVYKTTAWARCDRDSGARNTGPEAPVRGHPHWLAHVDEFADGPARHESDFGALGHRQLLGADLRAERGAEGHARAVVRHELWTWRVPVGAAGRCGGGRGSVRTVVE